MLKNLSYLVGTIVLCLIADACSSDLQDDLGLKIIRNADMTSEKLIYDVKYTAVPMEGKNAMDVRSNNQVLFGTYKDFYFGTMAASIVSQLGTISDTRYITKKLEDGEEVETTLDTVILSIPYYATEKKKTSKKKRHYILDSIYGDEEMGAFSFTVHEIKTMLHSVDAQGETIDYKADQSYAYDSKPIASVRNYRFRANDTVVFVKRHTSKGERYDIDTLYFNSDRDPILNISLNGNFFKERILKHMVDKDGDKPVFLEKTSDFRRYLKGLYLKVTPLSNGVMACVNLSNANIKMYYSNTFVDKKTGAVIKKKNGKPKVDAMTRTFKFSGIKLNKINHDHAGASDRDKIYLQGAGGYEARIDLLGYDHSNPGKISDVLRKLRADLKNDENYNYHVIGANIRFYIDNISYKDQVKKNKKELTDTIYRLFLYKMAENTESGKAEQLEDFINNTNYTRFQGQLFKDDDGDFFYEFKITDYITELLKDKNKDENISPLGLKIHYTTDTYSSRTQNKEVGSFNLIPATVILNPNKKSGDFKTQLRIQYSKAKK